MVEKYGAYLEKLPPISRRDLISSLAADRSSWLWEDSPLVDRLTRYEKDLLSVAAIAATLTHADF